MTTEKHRKEVRGRLVSMMKCAQDSRDHPELHTAAVFDMAVILSHLSEIAEESTLRLESHTKRLVHLTYVLAALTLGLFIFTIALYIRG
jgi:hypothetical protein